ncbi:MAG: type VII toxin-antitoxin system HepT family RNase toxin [Candidatus Njordarchaeales archaeon]
MVKIDREYFENVMRELREGLEEVKKLITVGLEEFMCNRSLRFSMRYSVVLIIEAAADLGLAILKQYFEERAKSYREVFLKLAEKGVISFGVAEKMASLASLRNMIVHRYWSIDDARIYREAKSSGVDVVEKFIKEVREFVSKDS